MAYDGKDLEIMVKGPVHDHYGRLLDRLITAVAVVLGIRRQALGETTWIRPEIERGLEADQCYVFDVGKLAVVGELLYRNENDIAGYPNPDLAVEVDISRPQADRPAIYAALQVPELWTFDGEIVTIQHLGTDGATWIPVGADGFRSRLRTPRDGSSRKTLATWTRGKSGCEPGPSCCRERRKAVRPDVRGSSSEEAPPRLQLSGSRARGRSERHVPSPRRGSRQDPHRFAVRGTEAWTPGGCGTGGGV